MCSKANRCALLIHSSRLSSGTLTTCLSQELVDGVKNQLNENCGAIAALEDKTRMNRDRVTPETLRMFHAAIAEWEDKLDLAL